MTLEIKKLENELNQNQELTNIESFGSAGKLALCCCPEGEECKPPVNPSFLLPDSENVDGQIKD